VTVLLAGAGLAAPGCSLAFPFDEGDPAALLADGFEEDSGLWSFSGSTVVRREPVHRGARALCAQSGDSTGSAFASAGFEAVASGDLWLRATYFVPRDQQLVGAAVLARLTDSSGTDHVQIEVLPSGTMQVLLLTSGAYVGVGSGTTTLGRDRWECLELHLVVSSSQGTVELYRNDARVAAATDTDTFPVEAFDGLSIGLDVSDETAPPFLLYVDDVAVGTERQGCP